MSDDSNTNNSDTKTSSSSSPTKSALIFGASGEQGQAVIKGLLETNDYFPIYAASHDISSIKPLTTSSNQDGISPTMAERANKCVRLVTVNLNDASSVQETLETTNPNVVFLVTTTDLPPTDMAAAASLKESEEAEYEAIKSFFGMLVNVHTTNEKKKRHVIFSTLDDVEALNEEKPFIKPLDDGSIVPHYSGKGRAGKYALKLLEDVEDLTLTLLTLPFLHSNFVASTIPLPNNGQTQWSISACFGDSAIDMFSVSDLAYIVPAVLNNPTLYSGYDIRVSAEKITLDEVATIFADLFGKDVIYNPLTVEEMAEMDIPGAPAFAQMCQFLTDSRSSHDIDVTETVMFPRKPQLFKDWLLTNSDDEAFEKVGLSLDGKDITSVTVFGATGMQGASVVKGLLGDMRKVYSIRAVTRDMDSEKAKAIRNLDPDRVTLIQADFDDAESCQKAVEGVDGVFLNTDFYSAGMDLETEEQHAKNVIDACEAAHTVQHLVFSTLESVEEMNRELDLGLDDIEDSSGKKSALPQFDSKARAAAYARTKKLSCTYVLMPVYSESFFELMAPEVRIDEKTGEKTHVIHIPMGKGEGGKEEEETRVMCMSVEELGPAVANIFDSYQVYAGHEIGLVTDFVTMSEAAEMIEDVFFSEKDGREKQAVTEGGTAQKKVEKKNVAKDTWVEKRDTHAKDLGQMFRYYSKSDAVKKRRSVAKTLDLVPDARPLKKWLEDNRDNVQFRQKLGLR